MELFIRFYWFPISQNEITCSGEQVRYNANREKQANEFNSKKKKRIQEKQWKASATLRDKAFHFERCLLLFIKS